MGGRGEVGKKNQNKIHARENAKKKSMQKKKVKKKILQKEGPIVTFLHVVKKNSCREVHLKKKIPAQTVSEKKIRANWKFPTPPPPITFLMVRP